MGLTKPPLVPAASSKGYPLARKTRTRYQCINQTKIHLSFCCIKSMVMVCSESLLSKALQSGRMSRQRQRAKVPNTKNGNKHYFRFETNNGRRTVGLWEKSLAN